MLTVVILSAGKGTRMRSDGPKVLFEAAGRAMIDYVTDAARGCGANKIIIVAGNCAEAVIEHTKADDVVFCIQQQQLGTAHAVMAAADYISDDSDVLILCGDMPLVTAETLSRFITESDKDTVNFISVKTDNPTGYGRVVRASGGGVLKIVEEKDANPYEKNITEVNSGVYLCRGAQLKKRLNAIDNSNAQKEYYLTDIVSQGANAYLAEDAAEFTGVNDRLQLAAVSKILWKRRSESFMKDGVSVLDPDTFYCSHNVSIGKDTTIYPNVFIEGNVKIGSGCKIYSGCRIKNSQIGDNCEIRDNSLVDGALVGRDSAVGPMAHLRPGAVLTGGNRIGNFVEIKKTVLGEGSKASHLTYLGDAELGSGVNVGCGTITCNYNGYSKFKTVIGDNVFIGSDVQLVAPVNVGSGVIIAAGTTVTKDVPAHALAISRTDQSNIDGKGKQLNERNKAAKG